MRVYLLVFYILSQNYRFVHSTLIASGQIEQCINEDDDEALTDCDTRAIITLSLSNDQGEVESLSGATLSEIEDEDGTMRQLSEPWSIRLSKSDVFIRYPLEYVQTFNAEPTEVVISTDSNLFGLNGCEDDPNSNPTCGWARDSEGNIIDNSQGFCCSCSAFGTDTMRGIDGQCSILGDDMETAHCLSFEHNDIWYSAYDLQDAEVYFEIVITVYRQNSNSTAEIQETIILSPSNTGGTSEDARLVATLVGDLRSYTATLSLDNYYFFVPSSPNNNARVQNWLQNAMLIEKMMVTLDGTECDKIGVSYHAFRYQSDKCIREVGDCLNNQLEDFHESGDSFAQDMVSNMVMTQNAGTNRIYFSFMEDITQTSLVTLSIATDDIQFVINRADGHIEGCHIDNFESYATNGVLTCIVSNDGSVEAMFRLSVVNCSNGINPIQNQQNTIHAQQSENITFDVYSENTLSSNHECTVMLFDSLEAQIDETLIIFTSTQQIEDRGAQEGYGENSGSSATGTAVEYSCESHCDSFYDVTCFVVRGCWEAIGKLVAIAIAVLILGPCLIKCGLNRYRSMIQAQAQAQYDSVSTHHKTGRKRKKRKKKHRKEHVVLTPIVTDEEILSKKKKKKKRKKTKHKTHRYETDDDQEHHMDEGRKKKKKKKRERHHNSKLIHHKYLTP